MNRQIFAGILLLFIAGIEIIARIFLPEMYMHESKRRRVMNYISIIIAILCGIISIAQGYENSAQKTFDTFDTLEVINSYEDSI